MSNLKVWLDGKLVNHEDATVPISTHSLQYGTGIFEGIRAYSTSKGTAIFRLQDHTERFFNSARIYRMKIPFAPKEISDAIVETVKVNSLGDCYIRPFAFYANYSELLRPKTPRISTYIWAFPFGAYFEGVLKGIKCKTSSWQRISSRMLPVQAKASGNYLNSIVGINEARDSGFDDAIFTSMNGFVAEGSGENIFIIKNGEIITPGKDSDILLGITRESIITMARDMGFHVTERFVHREELYTADEIFFSGTAAEVTPIINVDNVPVGNGNVGDVTKSIANAFSDIVRGKNGNYDKWLHYVA